MSYHKILSLFTFIMPCFIYAQKPPVTPINKNVTSEVIDSAFVRIWYAYNALDITDSKTYDDLQRLDISEHLSKYYSFFIHNNDSLAAEWKIKHPLAESAPIQLGIRGKVNYWDEYRDSEYFKHFDTNVFIEYCRMPWGLSKANCLYTEEIPILKWEIYEETDTIAGYHCQKATCTFRGREYIAWFSMNIPISNGPWKFGDLPGLILKVYDKEQLFVFECTGIEFPSEKIPITLYKDYKHYRKRERIDVLKFQEAIHKDYLKMINSTTKVIRKRPKPYKHVHIQMELE